MVAVLHYGGYLNVSVASEARELAARFRRIARRRRRGHVAMTPGLDRAFGSLPVHVLRTPTCMEPTKECSDRSTRQTVKIMVGHIRRAQTDPVFQQLAHQVRATWGFASEQPVHTAWGIFWFLKSFLRFKNDEQALFDMLNDTDEVDAFIEPRLLIRSRRREGDCDEFTMMACALLQANGIPYEIETIACDPRRPGLWSHIYTRAVLPDGRRMAIDATPPGEYPGWEVPAYDVTRRQVWDMKGNPIAAPASSADMRVHAYIPVRRRGVGDPVPVDTAAGTQWVEVDPTTGGGTLIPENAPIVSGGGGGGFNLPAWLSQLTQGGFQLGKMALTPSGYSLTPQGALISPYGAASGLLAPGSIGGVNVGTMVVWGGLAVLALVAISMVSKK